MSDKKELIRRWRMVLGKEESSTEEVILNEKDVKIDKVLELLYDAKKKGAGLQNSKVKISSWLGDIRTYFPKTVVQVMQKDAMERLNLRQMLLEPEMIEQLEVNMDLVTTLISLSKIMPIETRITAKEIVQQLVNELEKKFKNAILQAVKGSLQRSIRNSRPRFNEIDWTKTISKNLKHYQQDLKTIIPEKIVGMGRKGSGLKHIILCVDQSASMADSVVYASIFAATLASINALKTKMIVFDTQVADLTGKLQKPVDLLFGIQLGGGTDISKALIYCEKLIEKPNDTIFILLSDLYEGVNQIEVLKRMQKIKASGATAIVLLSLNDEGKPNFNQYLASQLRNMEIPCFACTPDIFPELMAACIEKRNLEIL